MPDEVVCRTASASYTLEQIDDSTYQDNDTEATGREQQVDPVLDLVDRDVVAGRDDTRLVQTAVQLNDDLARTVVIDDLELANVA